MKTYTITQEELDNTKKADHRWRWPGVTGPGRYTWDEANNTYAPVGKKASKPKRNSNAHDFDRGFGIGGINRRQPTAAEEMALINAQIRHAERESRRVRRGPLPNGQLWEPCPICRREPVCLDCGLCDRHCKC